MSGTRTEKRGSLVFWLLTAGLLFLRFPWLILGGYWFPEQKTEVQLVFEIGTYLLTAILILAERERLAEYHIDTMALVLLVGAPLAEAASTVLWQNYNLPGREWKAAIAVGLIIALLVKRPALPKRGGKRVALNVGIGVLVGIVVAVVVGLMLIPQETFSFGIEASPLLLVMLPRGFVLQLANAAAVEEPLFRGFLWGRLKAHGWKESRIWLFQAVLFMVGHLYYLGTANYSFFLVVPFGALALGAVAWRTRSIGSSMIAHGLCNAGGMPLSLLFRGLMS